jgi:hypothetical protein
MSKLTAMEDDDDFLLSQLTAEQIAELSDMIDPDVRANPIRPLLTLYTRFY